MTFRAGDTVYHRPSGEDWLLMCDEVNGHVFPCGWPPSSGRASDCSLEQAATGNEPLRMLERAADSSHPQAHRAAAQLESAQRKADWDRHVAQVRTALQQLRDEMGTHTVSAHVEADPDAGFRRISDRLARELNRSTALAHSGMAQLLTVAAIAPALGSTHWPWLLLPAAVALTAAAGYLGLAWAWNEEAKL